MKKNVSGSEYIKLLRISKSQLKAELKKPAAEQDLDLISECLESVAYCKKQLSELRREKAHSGAGLLAGLRKAGVALLVLVLSFAAFATVSEAVGFRVWTAIIKQDAGYLRVDYVPEPTKAPVEEVRGWTDEEYSFFSIYDFDARLAEDGFTPFSIEWGGYRFVEGSIRSMKKDYYATYTLNGGGTCVRVRMIAKANDPEPVSVWGMDDEIPYSAALFNGIPTTYQTADDGYVFATWQVRGCIFCASLYDPKEPPEQILQMIVR
ncbi:MAG: hypothetical protein K6G56_07240 [Clostridiales bacterium]|nr:hypothetical protein [Clostridiales bacterium]